MSLVLRESFTQKRNSLLPTYFTLKSTIRLLSLGLWFMDECLRASQRWRATAKDNLFCSQVFHFPFSSLTKTRFILTMAALCRESHDQDDSRDFIWGFRRNHRHKVKPQSAYSCTVASLDLVLGFNSSLTELFMWGVAGEIAGPPPNSETFHYRVMRWLPARIGLFSSISLCFTNRWAVN